MESLSDEALLDLYFSGDADGFKIFYQRHYGRVVSYARKKGLDLEIAKEVAQEAFLRLHRFIHRYERGRAALPWFFTIAHNCVIDAIKQHQRLVVNKSDFYREDRIAILNQAATAITEGSNPSDWNLQVALGGLSTEQKEVVELRVLEEQSFKEIASSTGKNEATLRKIFERARLKMKKSWYGGDKE